jgi:hypothetical protein
MGAAPEYEVGSTKVSVLSNGTYEALTGSSSESASYAQKALTPVSATHYPNGDLFPFPSAWAVYAGDCTANNPELISGKPAPDGSVKVLGGTTTEVSVPTSYLRLNVYKKTKTTEVETSALTIKITNLSCQTASIPNNAAKLNITHTQSTNKEGHLEDPFQPFGKFELCYYSASTKKKFTAKYENTTVKGIAPLTIYLNETKAEKESANTAITVTESASSC